MSSELIMDDETLEDLQPSKYRLIQKKNGFRFGMDSVLLAHFANIHPQASVVDFGAGSCVLPLLLLIRSKGRDFTCIEIQEEIADMAHRTIQLNHLENRIRIIHGNAENAHAWIPACSIDAVICNPPYGVPGTCLSSPSATKAISRNQQSNMLIGFFRSAFRILKGKGRFCMVYPVSQMLYAMTLLQQAQLEPKRFQLVYPYENKPANLVLIEAVKDAKPGLHSMMPLIIYTSEHDLTNRLKSVYHIKQNPV